MTVGEMLAYTDRFHEIVNAKTSNRVKDMRLSNMMDDLQSAYDLPLLASNINECTNQYALAMYKAVAEARTL